MYICIATKNLLWTWAEHWNRRFAPARNPRVWASPNSRQEYSAAWRPDGQFGGCAESRRRIGFATWGLWFFPAPTPEPDIAQGRRWGPEKKGLSIFLTFKIAIFKNYINFPIRGGDESFIYVKIYLDDKFNSDVIFWFWGNFKNKSIALGYF